MKRVYLLAAGLLAAGGVGLVHMSHASAGRSITDGPRPSGSDQARDAEKTAETNPATDDFTGSYQERIGIEVPAFRGLEPKLFVTYDSMNPNGDLGVGWALQGLSYITLHSARQAPPRYNGQDSYYLDGLELIPCVDNSPSASCIAAGSHSTKIENYQRIEFDADGDQWEVWRGDGTKYTYAPVHRVNVNGSSYTWRYALTFVEDRLGNSVHYIWKENLFGCCWSYLDRIEYNNDTYRVQLHWEARTDVIERSNGVDWERRRGRVAAIDVLVRPPGDEWARLRVYQLEYTNAGTTPRTKLMSIQQYGADAELDDDGNVVNNASRLPPTTFDYEQSHVAWANDSSFAPQNMIDWGKMCFFDEVAPLYCGEIGCNRVAVDRGVRFADVDGDGRTDMLKAGSSGSAEVHLGSADGWVHSPAWSAAVPTTFSIHYINMVVGNGVYLVEVNGDGRPDFLMARAGAMHVWLNTGAGWSLDASWSAAIPMPAIKQHKWGTGGPCSVDYGVSDDLGVRVVDVNGDGRVDFVRGKEGTRSVHLNTGVGWAQDAAWNVPADFTFEHRGAQSDGGVRFADVNGDGLIDLLKGIDGNRSAWINNGNGWVANEAWSAALPWDFVDHDSDRAPHYLARGIRVADVNGDGLDDLVLADAGLGRDVRLNTGSGWLSDASIVVPELFSINQWQEGGLDFADVNGDGISDLVLGRAGDRRAWVNTVKPELLRVVNNGYGGVTTIHHQASTHWPEPLFMPGVRWTVDEVTIDNGREDVAIHTYSYRNGQFDPEERRFTGFGYAKHVLPRNADESTSPTIETWFKLDYGSVSKPEQIRHCGGTSELFRAERHEYTTNGASVPYTSLRTATVTYDYGPGVACGISDEELSTLAARSRLTQRCRARDSDRACTEPAYDEFGNVTTEHDEGDGAIAGDERTVETAFFPNLGDDDEPLYIVNLPAKTVIWAGAVRLAETLLYYDQSAASGSIATSPGDLRRPPTEGLVTAKSVLLTDYLPNTLERFLTTYFQYDDYGNQTLEQSPTGLLTETFYDPHFHVHKVSSINELQLEQVSPWPSAWDMICGQPKKVYKRKLGGAATTGTSFVYDDLCRVRQVNLPTGGWEHTAYCGDEGAGPCGNPQERFRLVRTLGPHKQVIEERRYLDGLDRLYKKSTTGPKDKDIFVQTSYHARGQKKWETGPYFDGDGPRYTLFQYDNQDRLVAVGMSLDSLWDGDDPRIERRYGFQRVMTEQGEVSLAATTIWDELGSAWGTRDALRSDAHFVVEFHDIRNKLVRREWIHGDRTLAEHYYYDVQGSLTDIVDAAANRWAYHYDSLGNKLYDRDPSHGIRSFRYDDEGRLKTATDARGQTVTYYYDAISRTTYEDTATGGTVYRYDEDAGVHAGFANVGQNTTVCRPKPGLCNDQESCEAVCATGDADAMAWFIYKDYDEEGRLVLERRFVHGQEYKFVNTYSPDGLILSNTYPDGDKIVFEYDARSISTIPGIASEIMYDARGRVLSLVADNEVVTKRTYDPRRGWLKTLRTYPKDAESTPEQYLQEQVYEYNAIGKITATIGIHTGENWRYAYDDLDRLTVSHSVGQGYSESYYYDDVGNITGTSRLGCFAYNSDTPSYLDDEALTRGPQPFSVTGVTGKNESLFYVYDDAGNLAKRNGIPLGYDAQQRLITHGDESMVYDEAGERILTMHGGGGMTITPRPDYEVRDGKTTKVVRLAGQLVAKRVGGVDAGGPWSTFWTHTDIRGSVQAVTNNLGRQVQRITYRAYGEEIERNSRHPQSHGYIGERLDDTGLLYLHARYYDPVIGRFISADPSFPLDEGVGLNSYAYSGSDPINQLDPSGLASISPFSANILEGRTLIEPGDVNPDTRIFRAADTRSLLGGAVEPSGVPTGHKTASAGAVHFFANENSARSHLNRIDKKFRSLVSVKVVDLFANPDVESVRFNNPESLKQTEKGFFGPNGKFTERTRSFRDILRKAEISVYIKHGKAVPTERTGMGVGKLRAVGIFSALDTFRTGLNIADMFAGNLPREFFRPFIQAQQIRRLQNMGVNTTPSRNGGIRLDL